MFSSLAVYTLLALQVYTATAFPAYESLAGLPRDQLDAVVANTKYMRPPPPPGPLADDSSKLVHDAAHPYQDLKPGDQRGPCPALNTLASHGVRIPSRCFPSLMINLFMKYLPRNGVATPVQIVTAVQEGLFETFLTKSLE